MQYDLFQDDDVEALHLEIDNLKKAHMNVQRGLFARHNALQKMLTDLQSEINDVKQLYMMGRKAELVPFFNELVEVIK